ncbi:MAG: hypothetical protein ACF8Q5_06295 [Phycisphaerales bacterium JB040]
MWNHDEVLDTAVRALAAQEGLYAAEQAVYGLDSLEEVGLHPVLASGFEGGGFGVLRERVYPGEVERRSRKSARERCDLVLLEEAGSRLMDPVEELLSLDAASGTLFAPVAESMVPVEGVVEVGEAYWLEVKCVGQFGVGRGAAGPNRQYASLLTGGPARDVVKIAREPMINTGGVLVVLFGEDEATVEHDLVRMWESMLGADLPVGALRMGSTRIQDRVGHSVAGVGLTPVRL